MVCVQACGVAFGVSKLPEAVSTVGQSSMYELSEALNMAFLDPTF